MFTKQESDFMQLAILASQRAVASGNTPFGATAVRDGVVLHVSSNNQIATSDSTGHAEVVLMRETASKHGLAALGGATVYASGEPCAMCSAAMFWSGVARVVFAATTQDIIDALGPPFLRLRCSEVMASGDHAVSVAGPLLRDEAVAVLQAYGRNGPR
jgi:tRNA(adenine34) deaminase